MSTDLQALVRGYLTTCGEFRVTDVDILDAYSFEMARLAERAVAEMLGLSDGSTRS